MDFSNTAQDVARCKLCETTIVQSYCDVCHVNLCTPCIGSHIANKYDKHNIVSFEQRKSTLIYPKCELHLDEACKYQCKDCNCFVCSHCFASTQHKGHMFLNLEELFTKSKECMKKDMEELDNLISPTYEEIATDLENQIARLDGEYEKLNKELSKQRRELHSEIDVIVDQMEWELNEIKSKHRSILRKHLDEIKQIQSNICKTQSALYELEDSNEVCLTIGYSSKCKDLGKPPPSVQISMPNFIPKPMEREKLRCFLGEFTPLSTILVEGVLKARGLLDKPKVLNTIQTEHENLRNVICINEEQIWTSGGTEDIKCLNTQGVLQKTIKTISGKFPNDLAVDVDGTLLYSDWKTRTVNKVKSELTEEIIRLQVWIPANLCVTSSGDLLVSMFSNDDMQSKVVRYSGSIEKQKLQFDDEGKPLYSGNWKLKCLTENGNLDICVADMEAGAVVVVNRDGKLRFKYTGHPSPIKNNPLKPSGITTDSQSRILTSDSSNDCIHILDQNGQFLRYIENCDLEYPSGLCIDQSANLLVCELYEGNVKKIKYIE